MPDRRLYPGPVMHATSTVFPSGNEGGGLRGRSGDCYKQFRPWDSRGDLHVSQILSHPICKCLGVNHVFLVGIAVDGTAIIDRCA